jgi:hypothetical protein
MTFRGTDPESCITEYTLVYQNKTNVNNPRRTGGKSKCPDAATETMRLTHCNGLGCRFDVFFAGEWGTVSAPPLPSECGTCQTVKARFCLSG